MLTQAAFARHLQVDPAHIYRLKKAGRLVMTDDGMVDVEASKERIAETATYPGKSTGDEERGSSFSGSARERKDAYDAENARLDFEERCGDLVPAGEVKGAASKVGQMLRLRIENVGAQLAPLLAPITDEAQVRAILDQWQESLLADISASFGAMATEDRRK